VDFEASRLLTAFRLALKAKSETARIAAGRELLDRAYGKGSIGH